jgi:hypothetical protein
VKMKMMMVSIVNTLPHSLSLLLAFFNTVKSFLSKLKKKKNHQHTLNCMLEVAFEYININKYAHY